MTEPTRTELEPVFGMFGVAVHQAQQLEHGLQLLLQIIDEQRQRDGKPPRQRPNLDAPDAPRTAGCLLKELDAATHLTDAERKAIQAGIRKRNFLVHSYWHGDRILAMLTVKGRRWLIDDLDKLREVCRKASRIVDCLINDCLRAYGLTIDQLSEPRIREYEGDQDVPPEVLH